MNFLCIYTIIRQITILALLEMNQLHFQNVLRGKKITFVVIFFQNLKIKR